MKFRDMNEAERLAWGSLESARRVADLDGVKSAEELAKAQAAAEQRRKLIGATREQAASAVADANRAKRRGQS